MGTLWKASLPGAIPVVSGECNPWGSRRLLHVHGRACGCLGLQGMIRPVMTNFKPLPRSFYEPSAKVVAPRLLGHWLIRNTPKGPCGGPIVETEAYLRDDPACHGAPGLTQRNRVMFGPQGHGYVYFIYGAHYCVNAVCMPAGVAEAVLIRAIEPALMKEAMIEQRPVRNSHQLTNGPAKLCQALDIDRKSVV